MKQSICGLAIAGMMVGASPAFSAVLFQDQMTSGAGWTTLASSGDTAATFGYDYSADGIPEAPNSDLGDTATRGVKLEANLVAPAVAEHLTLVPTGQNFSGTYQLRFDAWMNFSTDDYYNNGAAGTTEFLGGGIGHDSLTSDVASGAQAIATDDGGSGSDWRAFKSAPQFFVGAADMTGGSRNGFDAYYSDFLTTVAPPAAQSQAAGTSVAGSPGFQWITWQFTSHGNGTVVVEIEKPGGATLEIVTLDCNDTSDGSNGCSTNGNISLFYADFFSSVSPSPGLTFGLVDNVVVTDVPEPASLALLGLGALAMFRRR